MLRITCLYVGNYFLTFICLLSQNLVLNHTKVRHLLTGNIVIKMIELLDIDTLICCPLFVKSWLPALSSFQDKVFCVVATCGQGEFPGNCKDFYKNLTDKNLPADLLSNVKFTTFGLGDSSYVYYNEAAVRIHERLDNYNFVTF